MKEGDEDDIVSNNSAEENPKRENSGTEDLAKDDQTSSKDLKTPATSTKEFDEKQNENGVDFREDNVTNANQEQTQANDETIMDNKKEIMQEHNPGLDNTKPNGSANESTFESSVNLEASTPSSPSQQQDQPTKPKKRLTLQERLALAAKGKKKSSKQPQQTSETSTPSPVILSQNASTEDIPTVEPVANEEEEGKFNQQKVIEDVNLYKNEIAKLKSENKSLLEQITNSKSQTFDKDFSKIIKNKDEQIEQLLKEGEALSHKELKLSESIKKLKTINSNLEYNLSELMKKNDDSLIKHKEIDDFLKNNKLKNNQHLFDKFKEINDKLESTIQKNEILKNIENKYNELIKLNEETNESKSQITRELSNLKIEHDMMKKQQELELSSNNDIIKNQKLEMNELKQSYNEELRRLEDKIENLRMNSSTTSKNYDTQESIGYEEFKKLSETHHNLQKQYLSSQENFKLIESNLNMKIDTLSSSLESYKKSKTKLNNDSVKSNQIITNYQRDIKLLRDDISKYKAEINDLNVTLKLKTNENQELNEKLDKFKSMHNTEINKLNSQIDSLNETIESLRKRPEPLKLDQRNRDNSMGSGLSWNDIRLGESSTTPAIHRDYPMFESQSSFTEVEEDDEQENNFDQLSYMHHNSSQNNTTTNSHNGYGGNNGSIPLTLQNNGNNLQLINKMSSNIRRLEIELNTMKDEYLKLMNDKQQLEENLLDNISKLENMDKLKDQIKELEIEIENKSKKEQTMLELIGEKSEQNEELKNDVLDLKELLKSQVQQIVELQGL
ncbi:uncharacterized protein KGF55_000047 [Candida pseudojiufengensis]|uniref:uncharacterized protein n=1 Tax=Candida pseudojiufengensis TaxID=497109 RepID=UPI0022249B53|nr:uncharacterized protein KGF55_000047 [Candida pseudojiufengensis]KAI5967815.1 hypothetical protein KGF55_000047 [Candida pseudojiufengensis]